MTLICNNVIIIIIDINQLIFKIKKTKQNIIKNIIHNLIYLEVKKK